MKAELRKIFPALGQERANNSKVSKDNFERSYQIKLAEYVKADLP